MTEQMKNIIEDLEYSEKIIEESDKLRSEAITKKEMHEENLKKIKKELIELGVEPDNIEEAIKSLEEEIKENLTFINENLPVDLLKEWGRL